MNKNKRMISRSIGFFIFSFVVFSVLSTIVVVGFAVPSVLSPSSSSTVSFRAFTTLLRYATESGHQDERYHHSFPNDMKVVDEGNSQFVYVPFHEMEIAVNNAERKHKRECQYLQTIIEEQCRDLKMLKEKNRKSLLKDKMQYDYLSTDAKVNWGENHHEKMKRTTDRVQYLINENERLQAELNGERDRFGLEKGRLSQKLNESRDETTEAQQILSLERSYCETAIKLLEAGLERESRKVKLLEAQLTESNRHVAKHPHSNMKFQENRRPYYTSTMGIDELPPFETLEGTIAYEQHQQEHHHHDHLNYLYHSHHQHHEEVSEEFNPQVRPQQTAVRHPQVDRKYSQHGESFNSQESPQQQLHSRTNRQQSYARPSTTQRRNPTKTTTTTVMGASSIMDNLGINDVRNYLYR
mmetsp:Transcript_6989/g.7683  ORF Transcript_6989/g.7683 Transcript_6989/m.7683 type:complete len:411 (+) Transcript_6989:62-1294(+)